MSSDKAKELKQKSILTLENGIKEAEKEISELEEYVISLKKAIEMVVGKPSMDVNYNGETTEDKQTRQSYPKSGTLEAKVANILKNENHAMLLRQIKDTIIKHEGKGSDTLTSISYYLDQLIRESKIAYSKVGKSNKHSFYALPEFLDSNKKLKREHMPIKDTWGSFNEDRMLELTEKKWQIGT